MQIIGKTVHRGLKFTRKTISLGTADHWEAWFIGDLNAIGKTPSSGTTDHWETGFIGDPNFIGKITSSGITDHQETRFIGGLEIHRQNNFIGESWIMWKEGSSGRHLHPENPDHQKTCHFCRVWRSANEKASISGWPAAMQMKKISFQAGLAQWK